MHLSVFGDVHWLVPTRTLVQHSGREVGGSATAVIGECQYIWVRMQTLDMNYCVVKYIHLKDVDPTALHTTDDFEFSRVLIEHSTFEEMQEQTRKHCPRDFSCFYPITLHHEVLWRTSLRASGQGLVEVDQLFQPIDEVDYIAIRWCRSPDGDPMPSVCVHIQEVMLLG